MSSVGFVGPVKDVEALKALAKMCTAHARPNSRSLSRNDGTLYGAYRVSRALRHHARAPIDYRASKPPAPELLVQFDG